MKVKKILILFFATFFFINCKKEDNSKTVFVQGKAWDQILNQPVQNLLIYVYDTKCENFACHDNKTIDSTRTDANGNYKLKFKHENLNSLHLICSFPKYKYIYDISQNSSSEYQISDGDNIGKDFILLKTSVLKTKVSVVNNLFPPLKISDYVGSRVNIYGTKKDTTVYLYGVSNSGNTIDLIVSTPDLSYYRRRIDIVYPGSYADTINISIQADPDTFPIKKYN